MTNERKWHLPKKDCPWCKELFIPNRKNQIYCCRDCQIYAANDRRTNNNAAAMNLEKKRMHNFKVLLKIYSKVKTGGTFHQSLLDYEDFNFGLETSRTINERTGRTILWTYQYGLELVDQNSSLFTIHIHS